MVTGKQKALLPLAVVVAVALPTLAAIHNGQPLQTIPNKSAPVARSAAPRISAQTKKVANWFAQYDAIRRAAQMSSNEKRACHKLMGAVFSPNPRDRDAGKLLLKTMADRYSGAVAQLSKLKRIPETSELHSAYLEYFKTARSRFQQSEIAMNDGKGVNAVAHLGEAKRELGGMDVRNKALDRTLRRKFNIPSFRG